VEGDVVPTVIGVKKLFCYDRMILFIRLGTIPACDRQTDGFAVANKALCITSTAAALEKVQLETFGNFCDTRPFPIINLTYDFSAR